MTNKMTNKMTTKITNPPSKSSLLNSLKGILAFFIVLFTMPLGHAAMILLEKAFGDEYVYHIALLLGFVGVAMLFVGIISKKDSSAAFWGLFGGLFVWTGWIEFAFVYYAHRFGVQPLMENGEIVTKPEYLIMPSSIGFWAIFVIYFFIGTKTGCVFFNWFQRKLKITNIVQLRTSNHNVALTTFNELILVLWTFYMLLLISYDKSFLGDRHPITYIIAFGSLFWSAYLFLRLMKIREIAHAIRYAIPTVIIFWNFVEIMGRWDILKEIWIEPMHYWLEITLMLVVFVVLTFVAIVRKRK